MVTVKIKKLEHFDNTFSLPTYESSGAAGADVRVSTLDRSPITIPPMRRMLLPTGLVFEIPVGYEIQVRPRSGLSLKSDLLIVNSPGTIDSDYRGELKIIVGNFGKESITINHGDRVAQLVLSPITRANFVEAASLSETGRGGLGFGSTGVN